MSRIEIENGKIVTFPLDEVDEILGYVDEVSMRETTHVTLISRLPQRRLLSHIHLEKVETYWLTSENVAGSISPSLETLHDLCQSRFSNHEGLLVMEGVEWLVSLFGFDEVLSLVMKLNDSIHRRPWSMILALDITVLDETQVARLYREAPQWALPENESASVAVIDETSADTETVEEKPLSDDGSAPLAFLVRVPREGYSKEIVRKRILQWRRMGLDVSSAEPALYHEDDDIGYQIFQNVESDVRRAVELDNRLDILLERGHRSEVTKMRFRIRQLTGFDDVEKRIDELI